MPRKLSRKKWLIIGGSIVAILAIAITAVVLINNANESPDATAENTPNFAALLPSGTSIETLGGWKKGTPPNGETYFSFSDTIGSVPVIVNQQTLPDTFKQDTSGKVAEMAKAFNATNTLDANGTTVHIGTNAKGPQSLIFTRNDLLISIVSEQKIQDTAWINYINALK